MKLFEVLNNDMVQVWRAFGIPMREALAVKNIEDAYQRYNEDTTETMNGYGGEWVALKKEYAESYGQGGWLVPEMQCALMGTFLIPRSLAEEEPAIHGGDDAEIAGETKRLKFGQLGKMVALEMFIGNGWEPFSLAKLEATCKNEESLLVIANRLNDIADEEGKYRDTPGCPGNYYDGVTSVCELCLQRDGLNRFYRSEFVPDSEEEMDDEDE